eukprot:scaffold26460_cov27-Tisochrysis_lutea.AAC.2
MLRMGSASSRLPPVPVQASPATRDLAGRMGWGNPGVANTMRNVEVPSCNSDKPKPCLRCRVLPDAARCPPCP